MLEIKSLKRECEGIRLYAEDRANWYTPGSEEVMPGDNENLTTYQNGYKFVFSITMFDDRALRMMTASVDAKGMFPDTKAVYTAAHYFGFRGAEERNGVVEKPNPDWTIGIPPGSEVVMVVEDFE